MLFDPGKLAGKEDKIAIGALKYVAIKEAFTNLEEKYKYVDELNQYLKTNIKDLVTINSNSYSIPHILNISVLNYKPETFLHYLEMSHIYISTQSACATNDISNAVLALTNDEDKARTSIRLSLSKKTTQSDIDNFLKAFDDICQKIM